MKCEEIKEILSGYVDGEASADEARRVEEHVASCTACGDLVRRMRRLGQEIERTETAVPSGFRDALFSRMEREGLLPRRRSLFAYSVRWAAVPLAAAAALALFVLTSREAGKVGPELASAPRSAATGSQASSPGAPEPAAPAGKQASQAQDARETRVAAFERPPAAAPAAGVGTNAGRAAADLRAAGDLSPEDREIVAYLDVLEDSSAMDEPSGIDELEIVEPPGGTKG